jgi:hypothetical protein
MSDTTHTKQKHILANQTIILSNQNIIHSNQKLIRSNQETIQANQQAILEHAVQDSGGKIAWFPEHIKGGARAKVLEGLFKRALITPDGDDWVVAAEQSGGFLSCDVDLGIPQELLDETVDALRRQAKLDPEIPEVKPLPETKATKG